MKQIRNIVFSSDLEETIFICNAKKDGKHCIRAIDARSAVYMATGICAQSREPILVCINGSNDSRSAFSGMTEAYYSDLPVALVTFGNNLDYSTELKDVVNAHFRASTEDEVYELLNNNRWPLHIEFSTNSVTKEKLECGNIQNILASILTKNDYLYLGRGVRLQNNSYKCKTVIGGMPDCHDGAVANVLGASLAALRERYIGLISDDELIHDMNSLGNINVNDRLKFIVIEKRHNTAITEFSKALGYNVVVMQEDTISENDIDRVLKNTKKSLLIIIQESE